MCLRAQHIESWHVCACVVCVRAQDRRDSSPDSQRFLPAFGPLFGHPRPPRLYQEPDFLPADLQVPPFLTAASSNHRESAMLGSGNFGVIPGGTYYSGGESAGAAVSPSDPYLYDGNGHGGRPHRYVQRHRPKANNNRYATPVVVPSPPSNSHPCPPSSLVQNNCQNLKEVGVMNWFIRKKKPRTKNEQNTIIFFF